MAVVVEQYYFAPGTLIPLTVYTVSGATLYDSTGTTAQGSTFTSAPNGSATVYLPAGSYTVSAPAAVQAAVPTPANAVATITVPQQSGAYVSYVTGLVTDGTTDNWATIQALLNAGKSVIMPSVGEVAISQPLVLSVVGTGLIWLNPGPLFNAGTAITAYTGGGQLVPTLAWANSGVGALLDVEAADCFRVGGLIHASTVANYAQYINAVDFREVAATSCGGAVGSVLATANSARFHSVASHWNNIENNTTGTGSGVGYAMAGAGNDYKIQGMTRRGGAMIVGGGDWAIDGGHHTSATTAFTNPFPASGTANTTVAAGSNGAQPSTWTTGAPGTLNTSALTVGGATGWVAGTNATGTLAVATSTGLAYCTYTGTTATSFTGCVFVAGATGTLTTGAAVSPAYANTNTVMQSTGTIWTGGIIDTCPLGGAMVTIDEGAVSHTVNSWNGCKFLGAVSQTGGVTCYVFTHLGTNETGIQVNGAMVDGNGAGQGFTALINNVNVQDVWGGNTTITATGWSNGAGANGTPTSANLWTSAGSPPPPLGSGQISYEGKIIGQAWTVPVTANAGTVPVAAQTANFTNSSAAAMAITMATTGAADGQVIVVKVYDFSAVSQTIGWTNTENSTVSAPTASNGSTTLPKTVTFMFNGATSKWRCIASV